MQLLCKTRGDSLPTGKARVYFFAHSEDYKLFFDEICRDILDVANCSIWYKPDSSEYIEDDLELTLGQMQLIVIPITNRFLSDSNLINSKEFVFIREKRIPILPILQETDILESYNKIFGNVQFMSRFDLDNTSIPFSKKLERFLKSVLLEDETIEQIKSEFDAHVFVSYRKKDRKYANEFIKLIECTKLNEFEDAKAWFSEAIGYIEQVLKQSDAVEDYSDKANCYSHIAKLNHAQGKIEEELSCYKESIDLLNKVLSKADFPECRRSIYKGNMAIASTLLEKQMDRAESKNSNDLEMTEEELYDIREHYLRAINVMIPIIEKCLNATMTPTEDGKAHIALEMIDDIKDVAEAWRILSYVDRHRIPIEKGILMYSWLKRIDPDNNEYDNCIEELTKMLDEVE